MNSTFLRQFWSMVTQTQSSILLSLSDEELRTRLQAQWSQHYRNTAEIPLVRAYIQAKIPLIRDLAALK